MYYSSLNKYYYLHVGSENMLSVYVAALSEVKDMKVVKECIKLQKKIYPEYFFSPLISTDTSLSLKTNPHWQLLKMTLQCCHELKAVTRMEQEGMHRFHERNVHRNTVKRYTELAR